MQDLDLVEAKVRISQKRSAQLIVVHTHQQPLNGASGEVPSSTPMRVFESRCSQSHALRLMRVICIQVGKLRCLDALGDYHLLLEEAKGLKQRLNRQEYRSKPKWREWVMQVRR